MSIGHPTARCFPQIFIAFCVYHPQIFSTLYLIQLLWLSACDTITSLLASLASHLPFLKPDRDLGQSGGSVLVGLRGVIILIEHPSQHRGCPACLSIMPLRPIKPPLPIYPSKCLPHLHVLFRKAMRMKLCHAQSCHAAVPTKASQESLH